MSNRTNILTDKGSWYISYLPDNNGAVDGFDLLLGFEGLKDETAIFQKVYYGRRYYILNGDWQEQYKACSTFDEALEIFKANIKDINPYSEKLEEIATNE